MVILFFFFLMNLPADLKVLNFSAVDWKSIIYVKKDVYKQKITIFFLYVETCSLRIQHFLSTALTVGDHVR